MQIHTFHIPLVSTFFIIKKTLICRYLMYGDISAKAAHMLGQPEVSYFFAKLIQRVSPKSYQQALTEVQVSQKFLENFCGDQIGRKRSSFQIKRMSIICSHHSHFLSVVTCTLSGPVICCTWQPSWTKK
uniref:Uncharacterized protein n=1 Tax=Arundo donax TaxID=35708 RepID=A0A0A9D7G4_ARUDO